MEKLYTNEIKQLGLKVKEKRESKSYTQQDLADKCEVDIRTIQRIERGDSGIGLHILFALGKAFELPVHQLLKEIETKSPDLSFIKK